MLKQVNIILNLKQNAIEVKDIEYDLDDNSILVQIRHTLIDTREGMDCFLTLNEVNENSFYYGYMSIGEIIHIGNNVHYCRKGMYILLPAIYQKFIIISEHDKQRLSQTIFHVLPFDLDADVVQALFYPLLGIAIALIEQLQEDGETCVTLLGCHALGGILMKLCNLNNISCEVVLGNKDVNTLFVEENGGKITAFCEELLENEQKVIILERFVELEHIEQSDSEKYINVNEFIEEEYGNCIWNNRYIQSSIEELLENHDIDILDMIGQHVHAESAEENYRDICEGKYQGKLLVYDW